MKRSPRATRTFRIFGVTLLVCYCGAVLWLHESASQGKYYRFEIGDYADPIGFLQGGVSGPQVSLGLFSIWVNEGECPTVDGTITPATVTYTRSVHVGYLILTTKRHAVLSRVSLPESCGGSSVREILLERD